MILERYTLICGKSERERHRDSRLCKNDITACVCNNISTNSPCEVRYFVVQMKLLTLKSVQNFFSVKVISFKCRAHESRDLHRDGSNGDPDGCSYLLHCSYSHH